ncbi:hypothetical protein D3C78_1090840 [compost metagenome]
MQDKARSNEGFALSFAPSAINIFDVYINQILTNMLIENAGICAAVKFVSLF